MIRAYLQLMRPANLPTAASDILAGMTLGGAFMVSDSWEWIAHVSLHDALLLIFSSILLYAGGVVYNDVCDLEIDTVERPERPIPSGRVRKKDAFYFAFILFLNGLAMALLVNQLAALIALVLLLSIVSYDRWAKKHGFWGPLVMGVCRGLNLLLGMSILGNFDFLPLALLPVVYIFAITLISRGEVGGNNRSHIRIAAFMYLILLASVGGVVLNFATTPFQGLFFLLIFGLMIFVPLGKAYRENTPQRIKNAVISGVMGIIVLDAVWVAGFGNLSLALLTFLLLPLSLLLSKIFAVT